MTQENNVKNIQALQAYNQEIQPKIRQLIKKQDILKEWANDDQKIAEYKEQIKELNDNIKKYIEETESELYREINDLKTDIKLAVKGAAKASGYKPAELNAYFVSRAKDKVEDVIEKGNIFESLNSALL